MDPFAMGLGALFSLAGSEAATFVSQGVGRAVRIVRRGPDRLTRFGDAMIMPGQHPIDVLRSMVAAPAIGDSFVIEGATFVIAVDPILDVEGLTWTCGVEQQP